MKNYRPVSNLPFLSKIIEKIVNRRLIQYVEDNNMATLFQSAYRKHHSTETSLLRVHNDIIRTMDSKSCVMLALLDLSAAFDTIDHAILLSRLKHRYGIKETALRWFNTYLHERTQSVQVDSSRSSPSPVYYGVPQGSILGPVLFTLYTSPLADIIEKHNIKYHLYADDTQLYIPLTASNQTSSIQTLQACTTDIQTWMGENRLKLNGDKTNVIVFGTNRMLKTLDACRVYFCDSDAEISNVVKNLGFLFDAHLTMENQISRICQMSMFHLKNISRIGPTIDDGTAKLLINAFVTS